MGYYTHFEISTMCNNGKYKVDDILQYMKRELEESDKFYPFECAIENLEGDDSMTDFDLTCDEAAKWCDYKDEMLEMSRMFPEIVFCLRGEGSLNEDMWYRYYKNGKTQYCPARITYDDYDESKLE